MNLKEYKRYYSLSYLENWFTSMMQTLVNNESITIYGMVGSGREYHLKHIHAYLERFSGQNWRLVHLNADVLFDISKNKLIQLIVDQLSGISVSPSESVFDSAYLFRILENIQKEDINVLISADNFEEWFEREDIVSLLKSLKDLRFVRLLLTTDLSIFQPRNTLVCSSLTANFMRSAMLMDDDDLDKMLNYNREVFGWELTSKIRKKCIELSGGNQGIIKSIHRAMSQDADQDLLSNNFIHYKMESHVQEIKNLIDEKNLTAEVFANPKYSHILTKTGYHRNGKAFSKLLVNYIKLTTDTKQKPNSTKKLENSLSKQEYAIFAAMKEDVSKIYSIDDLAKNLWTSKVNEKFSPWAIYQTISSLRKKLKGYPYSIMNIRGRGYTLEINPSDI